MPACGLGLVAGGLGVSRLDLVSLRPASLKYYLHFLFISSLELGIRREGEGIVKRLSIRHCPWKQRGRMWDVE